MHEGSGTRLDDTRASRHGLFTYVTSEMLGGASVSEVAGTMYIQRPADCTALGTAARSHSAFFY